MPFQHPTEASTTTASSVATLSTVTARPSIGVLSVAKPVATAATQPPVGTVDSVNVAFNPIVQSSSNGLVVPAVQTGRNLVAGSGLTPPRLSTLIDTRTER
jgi:hypothetical protein